MKLLTKEDASAYQQATINGALRGVAIGGAIAVPGHFALMARSATYRALPIPLKAFAGVVVILPCLSISAEKAGEAHERAQWSGVGKRELDMKEKREQERLDSLGTGARISDWAGRNRYGIIAGGWAASMALAFGLVARNPYQSFSQKLVQSRMWAQGLTVGVLVASALVAGTTSKEANTVERVDHSWEDILEAEGQMKHEDRMELQQGKTDRIKAEAEAKTKDAAAAAATSAESKK